MQRGKAVHYPRMRPGYGRLPSDRKAGVFLQALMLQPDGNEIGYLLPVFLAYDEVGAAGEFLEIGDRWGAFVSFVIGLIERRWYKMVVKTGDHQ